ncbi:DUF945 family protein [Campylobacter sp.]|uniref:DUF945 family protein n=1 Tax=Campylobacter sp. TaxID=205 RepID=UPI002704B71B|nr:DUF945 family protein [Campylobacter sp.]
MKKIVVTVVVLIAIVLGGIKFYASKVESKFHDTIAGLESFEFVKVENKTYSGGLFKSDAKFDLMFKKDSINKYLGLSDEDGLKEDIKVKIVSNIAHGISNLTKGIEIIGDVEFDNKNLRDMSNELFATEKPIKFKIVDSMSGDKNARFELSKIDKKIDDAKLDLASTFLDLKLDGSYRILENKISSDFIGANSGELNVKIENLSYDAKYEKPIGIQNLIKYNFVNTSAKTNIKKMSLDAMQNSFHVDDVAIDTKLTVDNDTISQIDNIRVDKFAYKGNEIRGVLIDTKVENIDKKALEEILNSDTKDSEIYFTQMENVFKKVLKRGPKVVFERLNFKNSDNKNYLSNLEISLDGSSQESDFLSIGNIMRLLNLKGEISIDTTPGEFFFKNLEEQKSMIDQSLLDSGVFVKTGDNYESKFSYNKRTQDIIFNNKISLKTFLSTMF